MGLFKTSGWRSWGWWCVLLAAVLAMATYVLFEELDVLGSNLASRLANEAVAALEYTACDGKRLCQHHLVTEQPWDLDPSFVISLIVLNALRSPALNPAGIASPFNLRAARARAHLSLQRLSSAASPTDPF